jgi:uncharacterized membrane protein YoaK (UPF0700 family)
MPGTTPAAVPVLLSFVAGYVDSCTFLALFGLFVAQVTGSFVLAGTGLVTHDYAVVKLLAIPVFFLAGVVATVMVRSAARRGRAALPTILVLEAALLAGLLACWLGGRPLSDPNALSVLLASLSGLSAMGIQSALVRLVAKDCPSTNVMTMNTTQLAIDATDFVMSWRALRRAPADAETASAYTQVRDRLRGLGTIVLGFLVGTITGAVAYQRLDLWCVLVAIAIVLALAGWTRGRAS